MTIHRSFFSSLLVAAAALAAAEPASADPIRLPLDRKASFVKFLGESFLHDFHGEAREFSGSAELDPSATPPIQHASLQFAETKLTTFHEGRDKKMFEWLKVEAHPNAAFVLEKVRLKEGDFKAADAQHPASFAVAGAFTFNGVKQPISGAATGWRDKNRLIVSGEATVDTSKFGLPQIREAILTVGTSVRVTYEFSFVLPPAYAAK